MPVAVQEEAAAGRKQIVDQAQTRLPHHGQIGALVFHVSRYAVSSAADCPVVCRSPIWAVKEKFVPVAKGRIDVDKVDLTRELFQQRPHYEQVVTPDELVPPFGLARGSGLVEDLGHLKGQVDPRQLSQRAVLVVLAGPYQFCFGDLNSSHRSAPCYGDFRSSAVVSHSSQSTAWGGATAPTRFFYH